MVWAWRKVHGSVSALLHVPNLEFLQLVDQLAALKLLIKYIFA